MKTEDQDGFCGQNNLNFRALRQADNIRHQLFDLVDACKIDVCRRHFLNDQNYQDHLEIKKKFNDQLPEKYAKSLLRKVLAIAFYFSTARLSNNGTAYLLNFPEGTVVAMDPTSALGLQGLDSPAVLFTELAAGISKGIMRQVSIIDQKWIAPYLPKTKKVDNFRLAGITFGTERQVIAKVEETAEEKKYRLQKERELKIK